jgi:UDP-3-O-[3-hydroxymyristoyl] glucosamine N-acyltransferase
MSLRALAESIGGSLHGVEGDGPQIDGIGSLERATPTQISWVARRKFAKAAAASQAGALIVPPGLDPGGKPLIVCDPVHRALAAALNTFHQPRRWEPGVHSTAVIDPSASLGEGVHVGPHVVIEANVAVGARTVIESGCHLAQAVAVGEDCHLHPRCVVLSLCSLGDRVILHPGVVLGADGFKYELVEGRMMKIPQVGTVRIGNDVEIGAGAAIDRASIDETIIGDGCKIDNMVQIGHNVQIGPHCVIVAQTGIGGSTSVGPGTFMGGQAGIADNVKIGARAMVAAQSGVPADIPDGAKVFGTPALPHVETKRINVAMQQLPGLLERIRALEERLRALEGENED